MLIVVKVLECIHASTVERRLPQLRGRGVVVALGTQPCPHWAPARTDTSVPEHFLFGRAFLTPCLTEGHKWYFKKKKVPNISNLPANPPFPQLPPSSSLFLIYLFRNVFEVEAFFYLLEFNPSPHLYAPLPQIRLKTKIMNSLDLRRIKWSIFFPVFINIYMSWL